MIQLLKHIRLVKRLATTTQSISVSYLKTIQATHQQNTEQEQKEYKKMRQQAVASFII